MHVLKAVVFLGITFVGFCYFADLHVVNLYSEGLSFGLMVIRCFLLVYVLKDVV